MYVPYVCPTTTEQALSGLTRLSAKVGGCMPRSTYVRVQAPKLVSPDLLLKWSIKEWESEVDTRSTTLIESVEHNFFL